jgi:hypothetical protein
MECEHHGGSPKHAGMMSCSVSCCHEDNVSLTNAAIFLLPAPAVVLQSVQSLAVFLSDAPAEFVQSLEPLSPPPRISDFLL